MRGLAGSRPRDPAARRGGAPLSLSLSLSRDSLYLPLSLRDFPLFLFLFLSPSLSLSCEGMLVKQVRKARSNSGYSGAVVIKQRQRSNFGFPRQALAVRRRRPPGELTRDAAERALAEQAHPAVP